MEIYIVEDDVTVISILEDIIEDNELGTICGTTEGEPANVDEILALAPDVILVDFLMPGKDGVELVRELKEKGCTARCIMISQVSAKELVGKAYDAGMEFFISKPINIIEVKSVIQKVEKQIENEKTLSNIKKMFMAEIADMPKEKKPDDGYGRKVQYILNRLGMSGEKGGDDIMRICQYLHSNKRPISQVSIGQLCDILSDAPKNMEQRIRRAIAVGMSNLAHLGIEDFMNDTFTAYSSTLFPFEEIRAEMDYIRGKRKYGGKVSIKKFIDSLMLAADREI
ncbi:DNA-binding domain-containing protein [Clostridium transplantifaecale]|uniref:DNA-binding domain-containing protein n=1 Tax=Clostridium transplantifaecale TaxID=2479838 RepID=UPI000F644DD8|nr:DNA-binding domain-containing protein [Clostridium transplantifaecale]